MRLIKNLKKAFGLCAHDGCKKHADYTITLTTKKNKPIHIGLCKEHINCITDGAKITSLSVEMTMPISLSKD